MVLLPCRLNWLILGSRNALPETGLYQQGIARDNLLYNCYRFLLLVAPSVGVSEWYSIVLQYLS